MNNNILSLLKRISKSRKLSIVTSDKCEFIARKEGEVLEVYFYEYIDGTYDFSFNSKDKVVNEFSIGEIELTNVLNKL